MLVCAVSSASVLSATPRFDQKARAIVAELPAVQGAATAALATLTNKPVLVTFFASWCPPCREEFANLNDLAEQYRETDLRIVAINVYEAWDDNDEARMQKFLQLTRPSFPALVGSEDIRTLFGGISRIPTVYGFDRSGELTYEFIHRVGAKKTNATYDELNSAAKQLLAPR